MKFWTLNGSKGNSYSSFKLELKNDPHLKKSLLMNFVNDLINNPKYVVELNSQDKEKKLKNIIDKLRNESN